MLSRMQKNKNQAMQSNTLAARKAVRHKQTQTDYQVKQDATKTQDEAQRRIQQDNDKAKLKQVIPRCKL